MKKEYEDVAEKHESVAMNGLHRIEEYNENARSGGSYQIIYTRAF